MDAAGAVQSARLGCPGTSYLEPGSTEPSERRNQIRPWQRGHPWILDRSLPVPSPGEPPLPDTHSGATRSSPHRYHFSLLNTSRQLAIEDKLSGAGMIF